MAPRQRPAVLGDRCLMLSGVSQNTLRFHSQSPATSAITGSTTLSPATQRPDPLTRQHLLRDRLHFGLNVILLCEHVECNAGDVCGLCVGPPTTPSIAEMSSDAATLSTRTLHPGLV